MKKIIKTPLMATLALRALKAAVKDTLKIHKEKGLPIYVWEDGRIVKIPAKQIRVR